VNLYFQRLSSRGTIQEEGFGFFAKASSRSIRGVAEGGKVSSVIRTEDRFPPSSTVTQYSKESLVLPPAPND